MTIEQITTLLQKINQTHLLAGIEHLTPSQCVKFLSQLEQRVPFLEEQRALLDMRAQEHLPTACTTFSYKGNKKDRDFGEELLKKGKVGCLILAGGQGTRLGFNGPKGMVRVTAREEKSLFQLFAERVKAASDLAGMDLPLCIMTSEANHEQTHAFFIENSYFGLSESTVSFFIQEQLPFIDDQGNWLLKEPGVLAEGPDGNGHALHLFFKSGLWQQWKERGVEYLNLIFVDNALADPFDLEFVGFTARSELDAALKVVPRLSPQEAMGVVVQLEGKMRVIEYSELPPSLESFSFSSTGMFCLSMSFIHSLCEQGKNPFPLHLAKKTAQVWQPHLPFPHTEIKKVGKCERFIFDLLSFTSSSAAFVCPREQIYAPLKNASGEKSLETVRQALLHYDQICF